MVETFTTDIDDLIKRHVGEEGRDIQASHVLVLDVQRLGQFCKLEGVLDAVPCQVGDWLDNVYQVFG